MTASFAVPFEEDDKDPSIWFLDHNFLENMHGMFKKVNAREKIIGWYSTGPRIRPGVRRDARGRCDARARTAPLALSLTFAPLRPHLRFARSGARRTLRSTSSCGGTRRPPSS
jgi:hypothetical protein